MDRKSVDIVIPIYNAYNDLVLCMRSVKKYTDLLLDRVILINDCSTDKKITPYLESLQEENIIVIQNKKNQGFSGNVNLGMKISEDRDVILLNSDTIVTKGWVDKILECAYSAEEIGTVTPLSNSATLCSVPVMCQDNLIPAELTIDEYAEVVEHCSLKKYPRITVAVGFCMFIKREVIKKVGLFDAAAFERGYGEENDFCNRAGLLGYVHVMCDNTFIYHKGTVSFLSKEKQKLIQEHDAILQKRYPLQMKINHEYCKNNPEQYIRDNINFFTKLKNKKKNILYLLQSDFRKDAENNIGGTQFHVKDMVSEMRKKYNVFVAARVGTKLRISIYDAEVVVKTLEFEIGEALGYQSFRDTRQYNIYQNILKAFSIGLIHVHHTLGLTLDIYYAAKDLGIPVHLTMHDFYYLCPNEKLLDCNMRYCEGGYDQSSCSNCLYNSKHIAQTVDYIGFWRKEHSKVLEICDRIYTPSESAKKIITKVYPQFRNKITVIYHGSELKKRVIIITDKINTSQSVHVNIDYLLNDDKGIIIGWAYMDGVPSNVVEIYLELEDKSGKKTYLETNMIQRIDVAQSLGHMEYEYCGFCEKIPHNMYTKEKQQIRIVMKYQGQYYTDSKRYTVENINGIEIQEDSEDNFNIAFLGGMVPAKGSQLAYQLIKNEKEKFNWFVFGDIYDENLKDLKKENLIKIGAYNREDLSMLLNYYKIDLICILSIWPETFCYTISEALLCDIPILSVDIGAMSERISQNQCGWLVSKDATIEEYQEKIAQIVSDTEDYKRKKQNAINFIGKTLKEMADEYDKFYEQDYYEPEKKNYDTKLIWKAWK